MTKFEVYMLTISLGGLCVAMATAMILIGQAKIALRAMRADHERRRCQSTFEYLNAIRPVWTESRLAIAKGFPKMIPVDTSKLEGNPQLSDHVKRLVYLLESLSVAVLTGVYDIHVVNRVCGKHIISLETRLDPYIRLKRSENQPDAYCDFHELVARLKALRSGLPDRRGLIRLSDRFHRSISLRRASHRAKESNT